MRTIRDLPQRAINIEMMKCGGGPTHPPSTNAGPVPVDAETGHPLANVISCEVRKDYEQADILRASIEIFVGAGDATKATEVALSPPVAERIIAGILGELRGRSQFGNILIDMERHNRDGHIAMGDILRAIVEKELAREPSNA